MGLARSAMVETAQPAIGRPQRSNSLEKGAAVLRALARTPSYHEAVQQLPSGAPVVAEPSEVRAASAASKRSEAWEYWVVKWEIPRKILHCSIGFFVLGLYLFHVDLAAIVRVLFYLLLIISSADLLRLNVPAFERFYESVLGALMRPGERVRAHTNRRSASTAWCGTWSASFARCTFSQRTLPRSRS